MKTIKKSLLILILIVTSVTAASCGNLINIERLEMPTERPVVGIDDYSEVADKGPEYGGTLKIASSKYDSMNPLLSKNYFMKDVFGLVFEGLVTLDSSYKPVNLLCEKIGATNDCKTWTYNLKKGITWHDGKEFTADDVKFTIDNLKEERNSYYYTCVKNISEVVVIDTHTITVTYNSPDSFGAARMYFPILPKHIYSTTEGKLNKSVNIFPIGTGMYKITSLNSSNLKMEVYSNYHAEKKPYIQAVQVDYYNSLNDIINTQADIICVKSEDIAKCQGKIGYGIKKYISSEYEFFAMNNKNKIFTEPAVRNALAAALNKDANVKKVIGELGASCDLPIYPESWANVTNVSYYSYNLSKARELLESSGWTMNNNRWYKVVSGSGTYLDFECMVNEKDEYRIKIAENMSAELKKANINMKVTKLTEEKILNNLKSGKYDAAILGMNVSSLGDISLFYTSGKNDTNVSGYSSSSVDTLFAQLESNSFDNERTNLFDSIKEKIVADTPFIGLYFKEDAVFFNKRVKGIAESKLNKENRFRGISDWYIPGSSKKEPQNTATK